jgi:hypothetical protein
LLGRNLQKPGDNCAEEQEHQPEGQDVQLADHGSPSMRETRAAFCDGTRAVNGRKTPVLDSADESAGKDL